MNPELRAASVLLERYQFARAAGMTFADKRDMYGVLGFPDVITTAEYVARYERGGIAGRIVDCLPKACWRGDMWIEEDEDPKTLTALEKAWEDLEKRLKIKAMLQRVDTLSRLSTYAVLLIGAPGNLDEELPKGRSESLLYFSPFLGGGGPSGSNHSSGTSADADATIFEYDADMTSPRFGLPKTYQLRRTDISAPMLQRPVHWSRIIHAAEGLLRDECFGQPALMRVWNDLDSLEKCAGGGAEAFWLRCSAGMHLDVDKDMEMSVEDKAALATQADEYAHQLRRMIRTRGVEVTQLGSDVANFSNPVDSIVSLISGATGIPKRILLGSEMGELASTQDRENFRDLVNGRQTGYLAPCLVQPLVDRLMAYGYLPTAEYKVKWPHIEVLGEKEKVEGAKGWAAVNQTQGEVVYTVEEIRDHWSGLEPLTPEQKKAIADEAAAKMEQQQAAVAATASGPGEAAVPVADGKGAAGKFPRAAGGAGSGWTAENGHVPGGTAGDPKLPSWLAAHQKSTDESVMGKEAVYVVSETHKGALNISTDDRLTEPIYVPRAELDKRIAKGEVVRRRTNSGSTSAPIVFVRNAEAAEEALDEDLLAVLEAAIEAKDVAALDALLGIDHLVALEEALDRA